MALEKYDRSKGSPEKGSCSNDSSASVKNTFKVVLKSPTFDAW
jgi:hypothetical protein